MTPEPLNVMLGAAGCALPLITTDAPGCREVVSESGVDGLQVPVRDLAISSSVVPVKLKYLYWIGPIGILQFLLTAFVQFVRCWQDRAPPSTAEPLAGH